MKVAVVKHITDIHIHEQTCVEYIHWDDKALDEGPWPVGVGNLGNFCTEVDGKKIYAWSSEILIENFKNLKRLHPGTMVTLIQREYPWWEMNVVKEGLDPRWFNHPQYGLPRVARTDQNNP